MPLPAVYATRAITRTLTHWVTAQSAQLATNAPHHPVCLLSRILVSELSSHVHVHHQLLFQSRPVLQAFIHSVERLCACRVRVGTSAQTLQIVQYSASKELTLTTRAPPVLTAPKATGLCARSTALIYTLLYYSYTTGNQILHVCEPPSACSYPTLVTALHRTGNCAHDRIPHSTGIRVHVR